MTDEIDLHEDEERRRLAKLAIEQRQAEIENLMKSDRKVCPHCGEPL